MSGPPASYYLDGTAPAQPPPVNVPAPAYTGPGFAAPPAPAWQYPAAPPAPTNTNPILAAAMGTGSISYQFSGQALYSLAVGVLGIGLPFFTPFYFRVLPIFGIYSGIRAVLSGRVIGGSVGIGLNVVAGIFSLLYMGVLHR